MDPWCDWLSDQSILVDPLSYFPFQPVLHNWWNKGCGMCYHVCGMMHILNDTLNTFYLWLYGIGHMVKDHSDSKRGNLLPPIAAMVLNSSNGSFICTIPQTE